MALLEDIIREVPDGRLRERLLGEVRKLKADKKFGLVYEDHLPEVVPLFGNPIRKGTGVARKAGPLGEVYRVTALRGGVATCLPDTPAGGAAVDISVDALVAVKRFGEPIFPTLTEVDAVMQAPADVPAHVLIEADNYHALQLLAYAHAGQVDCIYIDPPYNTGARDWKYNNDYVDGADGWRHSKWLAFMEKRLRLAKRLLKPDTGVLIVTIDEHEVHHLGILLAEVFPETVRQMVTIVINQKGVAQGRLSRAEEYALFCFNPGAKLKPQVDDLLSPDRIDSARFQKPRWEWLLRGGSNSRRVDREGLFFPIYIDPIQRCIVSIGEPLPLVEQPDLSNTQSQTVAWPLRRDGSLGRWRVGPPTLRLLVAQGYVKLGGFDRARGTWTIMYLGEKARGQIETGAIKIVGRDAETNVVEVAFAESQERSIKTVWHRPSHDSGNYGSTMLRNILGGNSKFAYPKSLYSTHDAIAAVVRERPHALIVDFFAGSGTTLNAVNLLNATDGGQRRCILVTNNEVSADEADALMTQGHQPGSETWEAHGICRSVTWPRSKFTIEGKRKDDSILTGEYLTGKMIDRVITRRFVHLGFADQFGLNAVRKKQLVATVDGLPQNLVTNDACPFIVSADHKASVLFELSAATEWLEALEEQDHITDFYIVTLQKTDFNKLKTAVTEVLGNRVAPEEEKRPLAAGFAASVRYFKLDFLDPTNVEMGRAFGQLLPTLWLVAGGYGSVPADPGGEVPFVIAPESRFAVLRQTTYFREFEAELASSQPVLNKVFLVTDSADEFYTMQESLRLTLPELDSTACVQLYRNYLDNFRINTGDTGAATTAA